MSLAEAETFDGFALYSVGVSFEGVPLTAIHRRLDAPDSDMPADARPRGANWVSFLYASGCEPAEDHGLACKELLEVQVWPACERNLSVYPPGLAETASVRGVPAATFEDGRRLEVYTGDATVVIFGEDVGQVSRAAKTLEPVNGAPLEAGAGLPAPFPGALEGKLVCPG